MKRRQFVGWLGAFSVLGLAKSRSAETFLASLEPSEKDSPRQSALKAMRFLNTVQAAYKAQSGRYADATQLATYSLNERLASHPLATVLQKRPFARVVAGFSARLVITRQGAGYTLHLLEDAGLFGYVSDESGIIKEEVRERPDAPPVLRPLTGRDEVRRSGLLVGSLLAVSRFFVPDLSAGPTPCKGCGTCYSTCDGCPSGLCCNWGTESCTWCWMTWASCGCP